MRIEAKTHRLKILGRRIEIETQAYPERTPPQTIFSIEGTLRGRQIKDLSMGGFFVGTKNGDFLNNISQILEDRIKNPQSLKARFTTE